MNRGFVLFNTVMILTAVSLLALNQAHRKIFAYTTATQAWETTRVRHAARSGITYARMILENDRNPADGVGDTWFNPGKIEIDGIAVIVEVIDEQGKLNINHLLHPSGELNTGLWRIFQRIPGMSSVSETGWKQFLTRWQEKYRCPIPSPGLLSELPGITLQQPDDLITVFGNGRINLNSADAIVLESLVSRNGKQFAGQIISGRERTTITSLFEMKNAWDLDENLFKELLPLATMISSWFTLRATAFTDSGAAHVETVVHRDRRTTRIVRYREW